MSHLLSQSIPLSQSASPKTSASQYVEFQEGLLLNKAYIMLVSYTHSATVKPHYKITVMMHNGLSYVKGYDDKQDSDAEYNRLINIIIN